MNSPKSITQRLRLPASIETEILILSHRRCCLCFYLSKICDVQKGQIAHLNGNPSDNRLENLVWLCLNHHDEFDSKTSQSKGLTQGEVREWRDRLYKEIVDFVPSPTNFRVSNKSYSEIIQGNTSDLETLDRPWRFSFYQRADQPKYFAYTAPNGCDGVCLIERIILPDGRIVIVCIQPAGNPGQSITNCVEDIFYQVCKRFDCRSKEIVWLENYETINPDEWELVTFDCILGNGEVAEPIWTPVTEEIWQNLRLRPRARIEQEHGQLRSKLEKLFPWPPENEEFIE